MLNKMVCYGIQFGGGGYGRAYGHFGVKLPGIRRNDLGAQVLGHLYGELCLSNGRGPHYADQSAIHSKDFRSYSNGWRHPYGPLWRSGDRPAYLGVHQTL